MHDHGDDQDAQSTMPRRNFVTAGAMLLAVLTGCARNAEPAAAPTYKASKRVSGRVAMPSDLPMPRHLPEGYRLVGAFKGMPGGFRSGGELALVYRSSHYEDEKARPLVLFYTRDKAHEFGLTQGRDGEPITVGGAIKNVAYYDGAWAPYDGVNPDIVRRGHGFTWDRTRLNAIVGELADLRIGIRGDKTKGVDRKDLIDLLASLG